MDRRQFLAGVSPLLLPHPLLRLAVLAGTRFRILSWDGEHVHSRPCFHAEGRRILFMRAPAGPDPAATAQADASPWSLWSVSRTGEGLELFFQHPEVRATRPDACPRSGRIAFTGIRSGRGELWVLEPDGTGLTHIPVGDPPRTRVFYPSWFPDGERIAVTDYQARQVLSVSLASGEVVPLTDPQEVQAGMCAVSPRQGDGGTVAFAGQPSGPSFRLEDNRIWLTRGEGAPWLLDGEHGRTPAWSPMGTRLAFASTRPRPAPAALMLERTLPGGRSGVFVASPDPEGTGRWELVPVSPVDHAAFHPKWSPQGKELALMVQRLSDRRSGIALLEL
jgi:hypothetical protein